jgi:hypothetical protein
MIQLVFMYHGISFLDAAIMIGSMPHPVAHGAMQNPAAAPATLSAASVAPASGPKLNPAMIVRPSAIPSASHKLVPSSVIGSKSLEFNLHVYRCIITAFFVVRPTYTSQQQIIARRKAAAAQAAALNTAPDVVGSASTSKPPKNMAAALDDFMKDIDLIG